MKAHLFAMLLIVLGSVACATQYVVDDFSFWCLDNTQPIEGDCLRWGDVDTDVSSDGLWHFGFMYEGNMVGWAKNEAKYLGIGYMSGFYSSELLTNERPDEIYLIHDVLGDGIGLYDSGTGSWYLGDDDVFYAYDFEGGIWDASQNILFGPDEVRGDLSYLPARGPQSELPQMIIDVEPLRDIPGDYTGQYGVNLEDFAFLADRWLSTQFTGIELAKLTASDPGIQHYFGYSVSIDDGLAIVGSYGDERYNAHGSAYLFDVATGNQLMKLMAADPARDDFFGYSVSLDGNIAIISSYGDDDAGSYAGSAYLFDVTTGQQLFKLTASDAAAFDYFGRSVSIDGNIAIVGANGDDDAGSYSGSAYLFDVATGNQLMKLTATDAAASDSFGISVAIDGSIAIVGADGKAYLFDVTTGQQLFKLTASDTTEQDYFGGSVAINNTIAIVGARWQDGTNANSGAAYLFDVTTGNQLRKLTASDEAENDYFGSSVAIDGNTVLVGAFANDDNSVNSGSAYLFDITSGQELRKFNASDAEGQDYFGHSVAVNGDTAIIGAYNKNDSSGAAYLFELASTIDIEDLLVLCDHWLEGIVVDTTPPGPNPATFSSLPTAISQNSITMTATVGTDTSGPVEYYFAELSGNPGGSDSGWQLSEIYIDSGLDPNTQYTYTVQIKDAAGNSGTVSTPGSATTFPETELPTDMIAYWSFDDGTATDNSGNGNNGTIYGAGATLGISGQALSFDGINDYVESGFTDVLSNAFTISVWYKSSVRPALSNAIIERSNAANSFNQFESLRINQSGFVEGHTRNGTPAQNTSITGNTELTNDSWYHIVLTRSSSEAVLYVDGSVAGSNSNTYDPSTLATEFFMGRTYDGSARYLNMSLDEVRIYDRTLSQAEVQVLNQNP